MRIARCRAAQCLVTLAGLALSAGEARAEFLDGICDGLGCEGEQFIRSDIFVGEFDGGLIVVGDGDGQSYARCDG